MQNRVNTILITKPGSIMYKKTIEKQVKRTKHYSKHVNVISCLDMVTMVNNQNWDDSFHKSSKI